MSEVVIDPGDMLCSHDMVSLFTNTPIPQIIDIIELLEFIPNTTYFSFRGQIYQQMFGTAMGSLASLIVDQHCVWRIWSREPLSVHRRTASQSFGKDMQMIP